MQNDQIQRRYFFAGLCALWGLTFLGLSGLTIDHYTFGYQIDYRHGWQIVAALTMFACVLILLKGTPLVAWLGKQVQGVR